MSYPEEYDPALKKWSLQTLPFIPSEFKYEVIPSVAKQFQIVSSLLNREDVDTIYVCTDSGREGEYIYRLVEQKAQVSGKKRLRVWIDSQTEEEILRGIREAKDLSEYDNLSASAYLRAQIKGSGIGTSATRAEILKKLIHIKYLALNKKTQIITPTLQGEMVFDVVDHSIKSLLNPELTASWEKGLTYVAEGSITPDEYMMKLDRFITNRTVGVKGLNNQYQLRACYDKAAGYYKKSR